MNISEKIILIVLSIAIVLLLREQKYKKSKKGIVDEFRFNYDFYNDKYENLFNSTKYDDNNLQKINFFIERKIETTTLELESSNDSSSYLVGVFGLLIAFLSILFSSLSDLYQSLELDPGGQYFSTLIFVVLMSIGIWLIISGKKDKVKYKKKRLSYLLKIYNIQHKCLAKKLKQ